MNTAFHFKAISFYCICIAVLALAACTGRHNGTAQGARQAEVVAYTYGSFAGEWGPGPSLAAQFAAATGYRLTLIDCGDTVQALTRAILEKDAPQADVIIGIDNTLAPRARQAGILAAYTPKDADTIISPALRDALGGDGLLTPYDYGYFALIYDTQSATPAPASLDDLTGDTYRKKIILMDPRTSTPGRGFLSWTIAAYGDGFADYWRKLKPSILSMTGSWSEGWGLFQSGEAPLVISYTTSPAYLAEYEGDARYAALIFPQGHIRQVEGYGLLNGAPNPNGARALMDYLLCEEAQALLPLTQWMYPVNASVPLPESYTKAAPLPTHTLSVDAAAAERAAEQLPGILSE